jgi:flavorubredoxin
VDECGAINEWLANAPDAEAVTGFVGALVNLNDFASRPARTLKANETFTTGKYRFRYLPTPHLPHGWDAGVMFEETQGTLFCSDLFHQVGDLEPITESDVIGRVRAALTEYQAGPLMDYLPFTSRTGKQLEKLAELKPRTLAAMHGSAFSGDGARALRDLRTVMSEVLGGSEPS